MRIDAYEPYRTFRHPRAEETKNGPAPPKELPNRLQAQDSLPATNEPAGLPRLPSCGEVQTVADTLSHLLAKNRCDYVSVNLLGIPDPRKDPSRPSYRMREVDRRHLGFDWIEDFCEAQEILSDPAQPDIEDLLDRIQTGNDLYRRVKADFHELERAYQEGRLLGYRCVAVLNSRAAHIPRESQRTAAMLVAKEWIDQLDPLLEEAWLEGRVLRAELFQIEGYLSKWYGYFSSGKALESLEIDSTPDSLWRVVEREFEGLDPLNVHESVDQYDRENFLWAWQCIAQGVCPHCAGPIANCEGFLQNPSYQEVANK